MHKADLDREAAEEFPKEHAAHSKCSSTPSCSCMTKYAAAVEDKAWRPPESGPWKDAASAIVVKHVGQCRGHSMGLYADPICSVEVKAQEAKQGWVNMACGVHGNPLQARVVVKVTLAMLVAATPCLFMEGRPLPLLKDLVGISHELGDL